MTSFPKFGSEAGRAVTAAAFSDVFDPMELATQAGQIDVEALQSLAALSEEISPRPNLAWRMRSDARTAVIADLAASDLLAPAIRDQPAGDTPFTRHLLRALSGAPLAAPTTADERERAIVAYEVAASGLAGGKAQAALGAAQDGLAQLRADASVEAEDARSRAILPGALIGRRRERTALQHYIDTGTPDRSFRLDQAAVPTSLGRPFLITGCAGSGKSALLADLIRARRQADDWAPVVLLDFDRPSNCVGGAAEWYSELTRQIGLGQPALSQRLKALRAEARQDLTPDSPASAVSGHLLADGIRKRLGPALADHGVLGKPLLVVLDTFEEVLTRSNLKAGQSLFADVLQWTAELRDIGHGDLDAPNFSSVRVLVSGRSAPALGDGLKDWFSAEMAIGALEDNDAAAFLQSRLREGELRDEQIMHAVDVIGGHPLTLILFARFVRQHPEAVDEMLGQGDLSRMLSGEDAARSLYARFLHRLHVDQSGDDPVDPEKVRRIAHPGLVLREVSPELLAEVIAPACDLPLVEGEAQRLFDKLVDQVWLVEEVPGRGGMVRHRPDVRRLMLPMMNGVADLDGMVADAKLARDVSEVRRRAIDWFRGRSRRPHDPEDLEAAYHRAFLNEIPDFEDKTLWNFIWNLAPDDVGAMPPQAAAIVRFHGRGADSLSPEQVDILPEPLRREGSISRANISLTAGRATEANTETGRLQGDTESSFSIGSHRARGSSPPTFYDLAQDRGLAAEVNAAFLDGQFYKAAGIGWRAIVGMADTPLVEPLPIDEDFTSHWIWRAALARMVHPLELPTDDWLGRAFERYTVSYRTSDWGPRSAGGVLAAAIYVASGATVASRDFDEKTLRNLYARQVRISQPGDARIASLAAQWARGDVSLPLVVNPSLIPKAAMVDRPLHFPAVPRARQGPGTMIGYVDWSTADGYQRLNRRLPELEPLVLALAGRALTDTPDMILAAMDSMGPPPPWVSPELNPEALRKRFYRKADLSSVTAFIAALNMEGAMVAFLDRLAVIAPENREFVRLAELAVRYSEVLRAD